MVLTALDRPESDLKNGRIDQLGSWPDTNLITVDPDSFSSLIRIDVWGRFLKHTRDGKRFFLTLADDYIKTIWVYLLAFKSRDNNDHTSIISN